MHLFLVAEYSDSGLRGVGLLSAGYVPSLLLIGKFHSQVLVQLGTQLLGDKSFTLKLLY